MQRFNLDKVITIEKNVGQLDEYGNKQKDQWDLLTVTRARVLYVVSNMGQNANQEVLIDTFDFLVRSRREYLENEIRIIYGNYIYECLVPEELDRSFMRIRAKKKAISTLLASILLLDGDDLATMQEEDMQYLRAK